MTSPSPSEFLTFSRRTLLPAYRTLTHSTRPSLTSAPPRCLRFYVDGNGGESSPGAGKEHVLDKTKREAINIHESESAKAQNEKDKGSGGSATSEADSRNSTAKAKKDHPEAPDVVIGMQDERGAKGH